MGDPWLVPGRDPRTITKQLRDRQRGADGGLDPTPYWLATGLHLGQIPIDDRLGDCQSVAFRFFRGVESGYRKLLPRTLVLNMGIDGKACYEALRPPAVQRTKFGPVHQQFNLSTARSD
jgi:hypothetical protein